VTGPGASGAKDERRLLPVLVLLTFATGLIDAASVLGLGHVFTANMTGNVVFLGFALAHAGIASAASCVQALAAFFVGALVGGRLAGPTSTGRRFTVALAIEAGILAAGWALLGLSGVAAARAAVEIPLLAFAMGIQNASVRKLGVPDMTTTVLTLTLTGLAADSSLAGGANPRVGRRLTSVAAMLLGALAGATLLSFGLRTTIGAAALVAAVAVLLSGSASSPPTGTAPGPPGRSAAG
jgi:uncharacterized membrane protein YoaK (UPF0700 family)